VVRGGFAPAAQGDNSPVDIDKQPDGIFTNRLEGVMALMANRTKERLDDGLRAPVEKVNVSSDE
jgi:hypothetical protein